MRPDSYYKTPTGKRYHRPYCPALEDRPYLIATRPAILRLELTPCLTCNPPLITPLELITRHAS